MILASQSPRRLELMQQAGYFVRVQPADIDESRLAGETPEALVERLARQKALAVVAEATANELVIGSDTVVYLDGEILGKPRDHAEAAAMLQLLSGATHTVATGVALAIKDGRGKVTVSSFVDTTAVTFYELEDHEIAAYAQSAEPLDKAGAYAIQGHGRLFVKGIEGNYDTVVGLPVARLSREMRHFMREL